MKSKTILMTLAVAFVCVIVVAGQAPTPNLQAALDPRTPALLATCKTPPPPGRGGGGGAPAAGAAPAAPPPVPPPNEYTVTEIPGVIAAGQKWTLVWQTQGNNADGIVGTDDGGLLIAQNDNGTVTKLDKDGKPSVVYSNTNTGGALAMNSRGALFVASRSYNPAILQLAPERKILANRYQDEPMDCIASTLNDLTADAKGGVYFTMGGLYYANPAGVVTKYGENLGNVNGLILSPDERILYVTSIPTGGAPGVAAFDVQANGALTNQRVFATFQPPPPGGRGGDGSMVDSAGRLYVTAAPGVHVFGTDGKTLGVIPAPRNLITAAFGGPDKKTLFAVSSIGTRPNQSAEVYSIPMISQGFRGRAK
jgi:gluconolactonase